MSASMIRKHQSAILTHILLLIFLAGAILPVVGIFLTAFKTPAELTDGPFALPQEWRLDNFHDAWEGAHFSDYFLTSMKVVIPVVAISSILALMSGFAFGTMKFAGDKILLLLITFGMMVPFGAVIIPLWHLMGDLGLRGTLWGLILPQVALSFSFGTFWMRGHFKGIPHELIDAAIVDGCNTWQLLWRVLFPLSIPALLSLVVLLSMWTWNEFFLILVMSSGVDELRTLPVGLALLRGRYASNIPIMAAASLILSLPIIILYIFFQRHFIRGMISGAIKG
jgi:raffinose/stachyose/melibiose transport system permease protein